MKMKLVNVNASLARKYLGTMKKNRKIRQDKLRGFARAMLMGEWKSTHQGIAFNKDGALFDGQHRCLALLMADARSPGISVPIWVCRGVDEDARSAVDIGSSKLLFGGMRLNGLEDYLRWERAFKDDIAWALE